MKLIKSYNKLKIDETDEIKTLGNDYYRTSLYTRILLFELLGQIFSIGYDQKANEIFKSYFGRDYDVKLLDRKLKKLRELYENEVGQQDNNNTMDFDELITSLGLILNVDLSNKFLYQLEYYEVKALEKIKNDKNGRTE